MTIQDLGSIGELIAAVATIGTLVYLAIQIKQSSRSVRAAAFQSSVDGINQLNNLCAHDESMARVYRVGNDGLQNLTEDEQVRYSMIYLSLFRSFESMYIHNLQGTGVAQWSTAKNHIATLLATPGGHEWWKTNPFNFTPEFSKFVEGQLPRNSTVEPDNGQPEIAT